MCIKNCVCDSKDQGRGERREERGERDISLRERERERETERERERERERLCIPQNLYVEGGDQGNSGSKDLPLSCF